MKLMAIDTRLSPVSDHIYTHLLLDILSIILQTIEIGNLSSSLLTRMLNMANKSIGIIVLCMLGVADVITGRFLPSYLKPCNRDDPNLNECLVKMLESIRPYTSKGIPEMHILPLDPIEVPSVTLNQGSKSVNFVATFTDLKGYGGKHFQVQNLKANLKNQTIEIDANLPLFKIESQYEINGKVLILPIKGIGKFVGNFTNAQVKIKFDLKYVEKKNNKMFIQIKRNKINLSFGGVKLHFSNLFNGNKELSDQTNLFINDNWKDLMQETRPLIEDTVAAIILGIFKPIFETFSMDDLLPV